MRSSAPPCPASKAPAVSRVLICVLVHRPWLLLLVGQHFIFFLLGELEGGRRKQDAPGRWVAAQSNGRTQPLVSSLHPSATTSGGLQAPANSSLPRRLLLSTLPHFQGRLFPPHLPDSPLLCLPHWLILALPPPPPPCGYRTVSPHSSHHPEHDCSCPALSGAPDVQYRLPPEHLVYKHPIGSFHSNILYQHIFCLY